MKRNICNILLLILIVACSPIESDRNGSVIMETECQKSKPFIFEKLTAYSDSLFREFYHPIDSINKLTNDPLSKIIKIDGTNSDSKTAWIQEGELIKITHEGELYDARFIHEFYLIDDCNWMHRKVKYHYENKDSICVINVERFYDTTVLNSFVTSAQLLNYSYYSCLDSSKFNKEFAKHTIKLFDSNKDFFKEE